MFASSRHSQQTRKSHNMTRGRHQQRQPEQQQQRVDCLASNSYLNSLNYVKIALICLLCHLIYISQVSCQLPDDIQRELNQNLAEQARLQALRARHQQQIHARTGPGGQQMKQDRIAATKPAHDPNNYSFQQISPPIQYSYYQPYGDLAKTQQPQQGAQSAAAGQNQAQTAPMAGAEPQQQYQTQHLTPHFTGAGGLPVLQPVAVANQSPDTFAGPAPLQPQAQTTAGGPQQGPPLTEADFKDITSGENYGAPGGSDFGMAANQGGGDSANEPTGSSGGDSDAQLSQFGMPDGQSNAGHASRPAVQQRQDNSMAGMMQDLGGFNPMAGSSVGSSQGARQRQGDGSGGGIDPFGATGFGGGGFPSDNEFAGAFGAPPAGAQRRPAPPAGGDFDFASQPSSQSVGGNTTQGVMNGGAPGSLQSLLGNSFPGLGGVAGNMGLDGLARSNNVPESQLDGRQQQGGRSQRVDDGALDIADLGDKSDGFSSADMGGFEQPMPQNDQDFNYAAAAEQQPKSVPYPDGGPQFVGTLWALGQPQSLTQTRYNPLPDKGTYQDYPAYQLGGNNFGAVAEVMDRTPRARRAGPGRYSQPSASALTPEYRAELSGKQYDYARGPPPASDSYSSSSLSREFDDVDGDNFVN